MCHDRFSGLKHFLRRKHQNAKKLHGEHLALSGEDDEDEARMVDNAGGLKGSESQLLAIFSDSKFDPMTFIKQHLSHLEIRGFENVSKDITDFSNSIQQEVCHLCPSVLLFRCFCCARSTPILHQST